MPTLEILDLSKNQITSFPDQPGDLTSLKVLSLTHNRIYTLPAYLTTFDSLKVFKVSANPIEWPVSLSISEAQYRSLASAYQCSTLSRKKSWDHW